MKKKYIFIILILIPTIFFIKNILLPTYEKSNRALQYDGQIYSIRDDIHWEVIEKDRLIGKATNSESFFRNLFFIDKVYSVKNDTEAVGLWCKPFLSEFGGIRYYRDDFIFPDIDSIKPTSILIGRYQSFIEIKKEIYAYTESKTVLDAFEDIVNIKKEFDYNYTDDDIEDMKDVFDKMPYMSILTDQVPFCALTLRITHDDGRYYICSGGNEKNDVTYIIYRIMKEGDTG